MSVLEIQLTEKVRLMRLFGLVLVLDMLQNIINPIVWIMGESNSVISSVARLSSSAGALAACWLVMATLMLPYTWLTITGKESILATRLVILGMAGSGALWAFLAWLARNLDFSASTLWIFGGNSALSIAVSYILALTINERQITDRRAGVVYEA